MPELDPEMGFPAREEEEEQRWLDALERGELDDNGDLKKEVDESLLTARQVRNEGPMPGRPLGGGWTFHPWQHWGARLGEGKGLRGPQPLCSAVWLFCLPGSRQVALLQPSPPR